MRDRSTPPLILTGLLLLHAACGGVDADAAPSGGGVAGVVGAVVPESMFDEAFVQEVYGEAVAALDRAAGIRLPEPVPALLLTVRQARERRAAFAQDLDENAGLTSAMDLVADFVFSETMLGRYLPDEKVLYVIQEVLERASGGSRERAGELLFAVMAHELVHAYDDQVYKIMPDVDTVVEIAADGTRLPELQARMSLIEGRATYAAERACAYAEKRPLDAFTVEQARRYNVLHSDEQDGVAASVGTGVVNVLARAKLVQYAYGREFAKAAFAFGGEKFFGQVFSHLPLSMGELEDFNLFKRRWAKEIEAAMDADEAEVP